MSHPLPLSHVRVLDVTTIIAGPFCTLHLAHMGAEVIKVEPLVVGDSGRHLGEEVALAKKQMGALFLAMNAGKKSIALNLKSEAGVDIFKKMVAECDVMVENFRAGVMDRLGLGYAHLKQINPALVYCAISGYGQQGCMSDRAAYDQIIQGISGLMAVTGAPPADGDSPTPYRVGAPISDTIAGLNGAFAIAAALNNKHNEGAYIDISMLESLVASLGWVASDYTVSGKVHTQNGNHSAASTPSGTFRTKDGMVNIATNTQQQWIDLVTHLGHPEWAALPAFKDRQSRRANRTQVIAYLESVLTQKTTAEWVAGIVPLKIPVGEINSLDITLSLQQIQHRNLLQSMQSHAVGRDYAVVKPAIHMNGENPDFPSPAPTLSQHTDQILHTLLGLDADTLQRLREDKVIE